MYKQQDACQSYSLHGCPEMAVGTVVDVLQLAHIFCIREREKQHICTVLSMRIRSAARHTWPREHLHPEHSPRRRRQLVGTGSMQLLDDRASNLGLADLGWRLHDIGNSCHSEFLHRRVSSPKSTDHSLELYLQAGIILAAC